MKQEIRKRESQAGKRMAGLLRCLWRGFLKSVFGTATAGFCILAVWGFSMIPSSGGYAAVLEFMGAVAVMALALGMMYLFGCSKKRHG